jgi:large subunit ribosomal protein L21
MNYAIIQISGKQLIIKQKEWYDINYLKNNKINTYLYLNKILFYKQDNKFQIGNPFLANTFISCKILQVLNGKKITILKTKPKKHYTRIQGYKSLYTRIYII